MQPKYEFQPALDYVKLRRNHAEFSRSKKNWIKNVNMKKYITRSKTFTAEQLFKI